MSLDLNSLAVVHQAELEGFSDAGKSDADSSAKTHLEEEKNVSKVEADEVIAKSDNLGEEFAGISTKTVLLEKDGSFGEEQDLDDKKLESKKEKSRDFEFSVCDLVWGKVRSHPWWPGQIYDPSFASDMALKLQKKDHFLVAYFGDKTFAWNDKSRLKPFEPFFPQMEKQSGVDEFVEAVGKALGELSRRMEIGLTCGCVADELRLQMVENAGIRGGTCCPALDRCAVASLFDPCRMLEYVHGLAQVPLGEFDKLEFVKVVAQLKAIYMSRGYSELAEFRVGGGFSHNEEVSVSVSAHEREEDGVLSIDTSLKEMRRGRGRPPGKKKVFEEDGERIGSKKNGILINDTSLKERRRSRGRPPSKGKAIDEDVRSMEYTKDEVFSNDTFSNEKKRGRGRPPGKKKGVEEDGRKQRSLPELMEQTADTAFDGKNEKDGVEASSKFRKKQIISVPDSVGSGRLKKKRLNSLGDLGSSISDSLSGARVSKIGSRISRVAKEMKSSRSEHNDIKLSQGKSKINGKTSSVHGNSKSPALMQDYPAPSEMLSQLCFVAKGPTKAHRFQSIVNCFFVNWRDSCVSDSIDDDEPLNLVKSKRGRKKLDESDLVPVEVKADYVLDSYWSDVMFEENPKKEGTSRGRKRKANSEMNQMKKTKVAGISSLSTTLEPTLSTSELLSDKQQQEERLVNLSDDKTVEECNPAALILSFSDPDSLPSESDLIRIFSQYGPLKEAETEVSRKSRRASVVFKRGADAEVAFSSSGKFNAFGPKLVSYRLRYLTSSSPGITPIEDPSPATGGTTIVPDSAAVVPTDGTA